MPDKLADCRTHGPDSELLIVEGNSAAGPAKNGRDSNYMAVLPLRGKVVNAGKATLKQVVDNAEASALITAIGGGSGDDFMSGGAGIDTLTGGPDADEFFVSLNNFMDEEKHFVWEVEDHDRQSVLDRQISADSERGAAEELVFVNQGRFSDCRMWQL